MPGRLRLLPAAAQYDTGVKAEKLMAVDAVLADAKRPGMPARPLLHGRGLAVPQGQGPDAVCAMVEGVKALGLESCVTLGMLTGPQAQRLKGAGLDYYNHNLDTSPEYYRHIISTRTYQDRLETLGHVRTRDSMCAAAALSAWAKARPTGSA